MGLGLSNTKGIQWTLNIFSVLFSRYPIYYTKLNCILVLFNYNT